MKSTSSSIPAWRRYHEATMHTVEKLRASRHYLDWANMPDPFRHYEGAPVVDLPAEIPIPQAAMMDVLLEHGMPQAPAAPTGAGFLSQLLFYSAAVSASKRVPSTGYRYALRVNPSSGNLHPTEFHFAARRLRGWRDGLYHYRPSQHTVELRSSGDWVDRLLPGSRAPLVFLLTSIVWREAWKYQSRAYRYCLLDAGHAWMALALAARALGCRADARGHFADQRLQQLCRISDEWPLLLVEIDGPGLPVEDRAAMATGQDRLSLPEQNLAAESFGEPNRLSASQVPYPSIDEIHQATCLPDPCGLCPAAAAAPHQPGAMELPPPAASQAAFAAVTRRRRSALDFRGGMRTISRDQLSALLAATAKPFHADFERDSTSADPARFISLYLYVHRVDGLAPGVYIYRPANHALDLLRAGDQRVIAAALSLGQELAGNACVAFSMVADMERAVAACGDRGYRYVHFEAGAVGQRLYLAAEAQGFQCTGIGAFYDDQVHRYLDIEPSTGQVVYHFSSGYAVADERLQG